MFRIKICGITTVEDARLVAATDADAVGLNFVAESPRCVGWDVAAKIVDSLPDRVATVGVMVNPTRDEVQRAEDACPFDFLQFHGDESPDWLAQFGNRAIIKAFRCGPGGLSDIPGYLTACDQCGVSLAAVLIDAYRPGAYGGTGETFAWHLLAPIREHLAQIPLILAGGLRPANVAQAIAATMPQAVDTASGVESRAGVKDKDKVGRFVREASLAFAESTLR